MADSKVGDRYVFVNNTMGIEEECTVIEVHPLSMCFITACGIILKAIYGFNEQQFIPIREITA